MMVVLLLIAVINVNGQPPFGPFGEPPPWRRPWEGPSPWGPRPSFGPRGPLPPFGPPPPWRRHWGQPPPSWMFDGSIPPPRGPPPPLIPPPRGSPQLPIPPPIPPPMPPPVANFWPQEIQSFISNVDTRSSCFSRPGENYEAVLTLMRSHFTQKTGIQFNANTLQVPTGQLNELGPNARIANAMYETDVLLSMSQARRITSGGRSRRKINITPNERWTITTIPYRFSEGDSNWQNIIRSALTDVSQKTCIRFCENGQGQDYLFFTKGSGCYSAVGRMGGAQEISIGSGCETSGIISHEVSHSLGLWHEQARSDRDTFVKIHPENMINGAEPQFAKRSAAESNDYGVAYDYGSVMHYASNTYGKSFSENTVEPVDSLFIHTIGSRNGLSFLDAKALNLALCSRFCQGSHLSCQHGGYPDPNNCNSCVCPIGLEGNGCTQLQRSSCGRELTATTAWQTLSYSSGASECFWRIRAQPGIRIRFQLTQVEFRCAPVCEEYVEIKHGFSFEKTGFRLCCKAEFGQLISSGQDVLIISRATQNSKFILQYIMEGQPATTRPPPTTRIPPVTRSANQISYGVWSGWSGWNSCSELCGACGTQTRQRACSSGGTCAGSSKETRVCNQHSCREGTTLIGQKQRRRHRTKRARNWCCSGFQLGKNNFCQRVTG